MQAISYPFRSYMSYGYQEAHSESQVTCGSVWELLQTRRRGRRARPRPSSIDCSKNHETREQGKRRANGTKLRGRGREETVLGFGSCASRGSMAATVAEDPRHVPDRGAEQAKTLVGALNLLSRNLPLPPDVFHAVSSIYHGDDRSELQETVEGGGAPSSAESDALLCFNRTLARGTRFLGSGECPGGVSLKRVARLLQRQRATRAEKLRFHALKADDQEAYMRMVEESKNERLTMLLGKTNELLVCLGAAVQRQKDAEHTDGIEAVKDSGTNSLPHISISNNETPEEFSLDNGDDPVDAKSNQNIKATDLLEGQRQYDSAVHSIQEKVQ
ncbi:hypothetical protein BHM03_00042378 [Ensete ventricosum]|nr:hypothetical protein BHM03_00042378 [Ensete ventricosum]